MPNGILIPRYNLVATFEIDCFIYFLKSLAIDSFSPCNGNHVVEDLSGCTKS